MQKFILPTLAVLLLLVACSLPEGFNGVKWQTDFKLPLINNSYYPYELAESDSAHFDSTGAAMHFIFDTDVENANQIDQQDFLLASNYVNQVPLSAGTQKRVKMPLGQSSGSDFNFYKAVINGCLLKSDITLIDTGLLQQVELVFPEVTLNGQPYTVILSEDNPTKADELEGYQIYSELGYLDSLAVDVTITGTQGTPNGQLCGYLDCGFDEMELEQIWGRMHNKTVNMKDSDTEISVDYPENVQDAIILHDAVAILTIDNQIGFDLVLGGVIKAVNQTTGISDSLIIDDIVPQPVIAAGSESDPVQSVIELPIANLMNLAPEALDSRGMVFYVKDDQDGHAKVGQTANGKLTGRVGFLFSFTGESVRPDEPDTLNITDSNEDLVEDNLDNATLSLTLTNKIPVNAYCTVYIAANQQNIYQQSLTPTSSGFKLGEYFVAAGEPGVNGIPEVSNINIDFSKKHVDLFTLSTLYYAVEYRFAQTTTPVEVLPNDYINVNGNIQMKLLIDSEQ